jgi:hypothetical protein
MIQHTHPTIKNPYVRCLLAHEILGLRKAYWRSNRSGCPFSRDTLTKYLIATDSSYTHMAYHFQADSTALLSGDPSPLALYPAMSFAGHA